MKPHLRRPLVFTLLISTLIFSSCGKKNVVNSSATSTDANYSAFSTNSQFYTYYNTIKNKISCLSGRYRLSSDVVFHVDGGAYSQSTIYSQSYSTGTTSSGTASEMYVGVSAYRDLMFVTKMTNNGTLVGYNIVISMCSIPNSNSVYPALVSNERTLSNLMTPNGIVVNTNTSCGYGLIAAAFNTVMISQAIPNNAYTANFPVYTTFTNAGCF